MPPLLAQYDFFLLGWSFLIDMLGSPKLTFLTSLPFLARTVNLLEPDVFLFGLLYPEKVSPLYSNLSPFFFTSLVVAIS